MYNIIKLRFLKKGHKNNINKHWVNVQEIIVLIIFICLFAVFSCEDLTRLPQDQITSEQYWNSPEDIEIYVNQFYPYFRRQFSFWAPDLYYGDGDSDNMAARTDISQNNDRIGGLYTINSGRGSWSAWYNRIRDVNIAIESSIENGLQDEVKSRRFIGEAYFFRAYFHYQLLRSFGAVPWIEKPLNTESEELYKPRTPRNELVDLILTDLDYAITQIPPKSTVGINRINKETALQFKSQVALYEGTWEKYHKDDPFGVNNPNPEKYLNIAAVAAKELIDMETASLAPNYSKLFNQDDMDGNPEILMERQYNASIGLSAMVQRRIAQHGGGTGLTKSLVDSYLMDDGEPIAISNRYLGDESLKSVVINRDPRLHAILKVPGDTLHLNSDLTPRIFVKPRLSGGGVVETSTGYSLKKGANPDAIVPGNAQQSPALPLFRFAEALLNYAEAKAELGIITQQDLDISINRLRDRVKMPHLILNEITMDPNWEYPDLSPIINEIRRERRVELACESFRLDDILRWAAGDNLLSGIILLGAKFNQALHPDIVIGKDVILNDEGYILPLIKRFPNGFGFDPTRDYLVAIPPEEITLNPNLTQNPGW